MDKKTEALKLALEALEQWETGCTTMEYLAKVEKAVPLVREALAEQPAQQQEPVATVTSESENPNVSMSWWHEPALPVGTKLYTSPQPSKPWVGLTPAEAGALWKVGMTPHEFSCAIEAKLRGKNAAPCKPLTDAEIEKICPKFEDPVRREMWVLGFKAAHGIKGDE